MDPGRRDDMADKKDTRATKDLEPTDKEAAEVKGGQAYSPQKKKKFLKRAGAPAPGGGNAKPM
jgi:hypothetical protein